MAVHEHEQDEYDPFACLLTPPLDETAEERMVRLREEEEARRVSNAIDEGIRQEQETMKNSNVLKMLLLGQSGSGMFNAKTVHPRIVTDEYNCIKGNRLL